MEYTILIANDPSTLSSLVNNLIEHGWQPTGGVAVTAGQDAQEEPSIETWAQAMMKRDAAQQSQHISGITEETDARALIHDAMREARKVLDHARIF